MDAVMFHVKGAHLALQRVGRGLLRRNGLTPARFDLLHALGSRGLTQSALWRRLGVVRSAVSEMLRSLRALGWVKRVRAPDGRTWLVQLTNRGRRLFEPAYDRWVESGYTTVCIDAALVQRHAGLDAERHRLEILYACEALEDEFRVRAPGADLYGWSPEDYYFWLTEPGGFPGDVPFVTEMTAPGSAEPTV
jgi:DNA-binding MarR family transcriptional regulator